MRQKIPKERDKILEDNENLHNKVYQMEHDYKVKSNSLDFRYNNRKEELEKEFEEKAFNLEYEYKHKIYKLEKENTRLHKIIKTFEETVKNLLNGFVTNLNYLLKMKLLEISKKKLEIL